MIQMTRQEYQQKYGTTPSVQPSTQTVTAGSQPIKMTRQQYAQKYGSTPGLKPLTKPEATKTSLVEKIAGAAPIAGGVIGGITGGILGGASGSIVPGAGTVAGGLAGSGAGTALGTMGGNVIKNELLNLFGKQTKAPIEQLKQVGKESLIAGATDIATGGLLHGAGKVLSPVTKSVSKLVSDIPLKSIRANPSQITKWNAKAGEDLSSWMVKNKVLGENAVDIAEKNADVLQQQFDNLALNENITIPVNKLKERFAGEIRNLAGVSQEGVKNQVVPSFNKDIARKVLAEWDNIVKQVGQMGTDNLTPYQLTMMRRAIDEVIPKSAWTTPTIKNTALRLRSMLNDVVQEGVDARMIGVGQKGSLKSLGKELSKYYDFLDIAERQSNLGRGSLVANLPRILSSGGAGTIGAVAGGLPGAIIGASAGLAGEAALRSPSVLKGIYQTGKRLPLYGKSASKLFQRIPSAITTGLITK